MKVNGKEIKTGAFAGSVGVLTVLAVSAFFAWLISREILGFAYLDYAAAGALLSGGFLGGLTCGRGEGRWIRAGMAVGWMILILLAVNQIGFEGSLPGLIPCIVLVLGSVAAAVLAMGDKKGRKRRSYQIKKYRTG